MLGYRGAQWTFNVLAGNVKNCPVAVDIPPVGEK
jgi:hypothetical protein